jgi:glycosyltransferase involved in cell wall biosynthesis
MRIAFASQEYPPETGFGGIGSQTYRKAHGLAALGHEVYVISHCRDADRHEYDQENVRVIRIPGGDDELPIATEAARWLSYSVKVAAEIARLHAAVHLDLIDFPEWGGEAYVHLLNRTEWNYVPSLIQLHGPIVMFAHAIGWPDVESELYRAAHAMEGTCLRLADAVYSSSRCSAKWCERYYGLDATAIPVLHTGVDIDQFHRRAVPKNTRPTIVFVGKIETNKGVEVLVDAACRLADEFPALRLQLIGRGRSKLIEQLLQTAAIAGHRDLIDLPGYVAPESLPEYLSRAHVFAAPSIYEGGPGFVYLEAMACELPAVGCRSGGVCEVIEDGVTGILTPAGDAELLYSALARLLSDDCLRDTMGRQGREWVEREANSLDCLRLLESFYLEAVHKCGHPLERVK